MKKFKTLFTILILASSSLLATTCSDGPTTISITSSPVTNTLGAQDIDSLEGKDCSGADVNSFRIRTLPAASAGVLYMADGVTPVTVNQTLTRVQTNGLRFNPLTSFTGNASFSYASIDENGFLDQTEPAATVSIPVIAGNIPSCATPTTENIVNANLLNTLGAVNILNLAGKDCNGTEVESFQITTLPAANSGVLYMADGVTAVVAGQTLTRAEADALRFDPLVGFVGNASFTYVAIDGNGVKDPTAATVTLPIIAGGACIEPTTDNIVNSNLLNTLGAVNILNLAGKDCNGTEVESFQITTLPAANSGVLYMADGVTAVVAGQTLTRAEADALRFDPLVGFVGNASFTYVAIDGNGVLDTSPATVTIPLINALTVTDIVANPDTAIAQGNANPITINVLANDTGTLNGARVYLLNADGTVTDRLVVNGEGVWNVNADNTITFTPVAPFVGTPSPVRYLVEDANGVRSNNSLISIAGNCVCEDYETSVPSLSVSSLLLLVLLISSMGIFFTRREELN